MAPRGYDRPPAAHGALARRLAVLLVLGLAGATVAAAMGLLLHPFFLAFVPEAALSATLGGFVLMRRLRAARQATACARAVVLALLLAQVPFTIALLLVGPLDPLDPPALSEIGGIAEGFATLLLLGWLVAGPFHVVGGCVAGHLLFGLLDGRGMARPRLMAAPPSPAGAERLTPDGCTPSSPSR